jgi:hypothetical protein
VPPADRRLLRHPRLPQVVGVALSLELLAAAAALTFTPTPAPTVASAVPVPVAAVAAVAADAPLALAAPGLWEGAVRAEPLGLDAVGALAVPASARGLGWWADGPRPGEAGAAVVVGHVDLKGRPGVFGRLATARPGAVVTVTRGPRTVRYRVTRVDRYAKTGFPTDVVYRPTGAAELRLVTCGGRFDPRTGHYEDNVVVTAVRA